MLGAPRARRQGLAVPALTSFGEDACGRIHTASLDGTVSRLQDGAPSRAASRPRRARLPGAPPPGAAPDARAPLLRISYRGTQRLRRLRLMLRADEDCTVTLRARRFRTAASAWGRGKARRPARATRKGARRLRRAVARSGRRRVVRLAARDAAGNVRVRHVRLGVL